MKIYTKQGDDGTTGLRGGQRTLKSDPLIELIGQVDELNAGIGLVRSLENRPMEDAFWNAVQSDLFALGGDLACVPSDDPTALDESLVSGADVVSARVAGIERTIDAIDSQLSPLQCFVLPGGTMAAAQLHLARTICRRAERTMVALEERLSGLPSAREHAVYLNRLSDLLFVLARFANQQAGREDIPWDPAKSPSASELLEN